LAIRQTILTHPRYFTYEQSIGDSLEEAGHTKLPGGTEHGWEMPPDHATEEFWAACKGAKVFDLGCGTGRAVSRPALLWGAERVFAMDVHPESLESLRSRAQTEGTTDRLGAVLLDPGWWNQGLLEQPTISSILGVREGPEVPIDGSLDLIMARQCLQFGQPESVLSFLDLASAALGPGREAWAINMSPYLQYVWDCTKPLDEGEPCAPGARLKEIAKRNEEFARNGTGSPGGFGSLADCSDFSSQMFLYFDKATIQGLFSWWKRSRRSRRLPEDLEVTRSEYFGPRQIWASNKFVANSEDANQEVHVFIVRKSGLPQPRAAVIEMPPYRPPEDLGDLAKQHEIAREEFIKLDANENPWGPSAKVVEALASLPDDNYNYSIYPDPEQRKTRRIVADYARVDPDQVMLGNGSDELIDLVCRVYLNPGDEVVSCTPTFGMYSFTTSLCGGICREVPRGPDWEVDLEAVWAAISPRSKLIIVASPNNPTGNRMDLATLEGLLSTRRYVVVDEAYIEFAGALGADSWAPLVERYENLIVLRTFSKWAGLAGLRVGYGVFPRQVHNQLFKAKPPFNLNVAGEVAVRATLSDLASVQLKVQEIVAERQRMEAALRSIPSLRVWPSEANFLLVQPRKGISVHLREHLARHKVAVRQYSDLSLEGAVRISVGMPKDNDLVVEALNAWKPAGNG